MEAGPEIRSGLRGRAGLLASALGTVAAHAATPDSLSGSAFGASASLGGVVTVPATPTVTLPADGSAQSANVASVPVAGLGSTGATTVTTAGTAVGTAAESVTSTASVNGLDALASALSAGAIDTTCTSYAGGSTAATTVTNLQIGGTPITLPSTLPANYQLTDGALAGVASVVLNAQTLSNQTGATSVTVYGARITIAATNAVVDVAASACGAAGTDINAGSASTTPSSAPTTSTITPAAGPTAGSTPVIITGTGFSGGDTVDFDGIPATDVTATSPTTLSAISPIGPAGPVQVTVTDPATGLTSNGQTFTYAATGSQPSVSGMTPTSGVPAGGNTVTITGTNLCDISSVTFGNTPSTSVTANSGCTMLTVTVPAGSGSVRVDVATMNGAAFSPIGYTYTQPGYWEAASDGGVFAFGAAQFYGSTGNIKLNQPIVAMAQTPDRRGYWLFAKDGGVFAFGDAKFYGSVPGVLNPGQTLNAPIVAAEASPDGMGYRMFAADGGVFDFGDAQFTGSLPGIGVTPNKPVVAAVSTPVGQGYLLVAGDGGVFTFGNGTFNGSLGAAATSGIVSMAETTSGNGYWVFGANGAVYPFGDASSLGQAVGTVTAPVVSGVATTTNQGYWLFGTDGNVYPFGDASNLGSLLGTPLNDPIVGGAGF
jgi:IPT/TIG domain